MRRFGWADNTLARLGSILARFPDDGARIEALVLGGYFGYGGDQTRMFKDRVLDRPGLVGLRTVITTRSSTLDKPTAEACRERRIVVEREW